MSTLENGICQKENTTIYEECAQAEWQIARWSEIRGTLKTNEVNPKTGKTRFKRHGATTVALKDFAQSITTRNACFSAPGMDIDRLRALPKDERDRAKTQAVYAYCVANRNATHTEMATLEERDLNDLVCLDFDCDGDGEHLTPATAPAIRDKCAQSPACVLSALSLSGAGAFAVMRVYGGFWADMLRKGDDYRKARMTALFDLMQRELGVRAKCDDACKDATRLRAGSFDAQAFYNPGCNHHISKAAIDAESARLNAVCARLNAPLIAAKSSDNAPNSTPKSSDDMTITEAEQAFDAARAQTAREAEQVLARSKQRVTLCASKAKALEALAKLATLKRNNGAGVHAQVWRVALNLYERCFIAADFDVNEIEAMVVEACKTNGEYQERPNDVLQSIREAKKEAELKCAAKQVQAKAKREQAQASACAEQHFLAPYWERLRYDTFADNYLDVETGERHNIDHIGAWIARDLTAYSGKYVWIAKGIDLVVSNVRRVPERCFDGLLERAQELASEGECGAIDDYCARCGFDAYESKRLRLWLYQLAARAFIPGEKTDNILIFASRLQGIGKTWFCDMISRALCGTGAFEYRKEAGKDARIMMSRASVARLDEVDVWTRKTDLATLKSLMTETQSIERAPYAHASEQRLYRAVLVGTTNKEDIIPEGEEMARRYWILKPRGNMWLDLKTARAIVSEACADVLACISKETYDAYNARTKIWLETAEEIEENTNRNAHHKDAGNATFAITHGVNMIRALVKKSQSYVGYGQRWVFDDTACFGAREWAAIFTTGETTTIGGSEHFTPIRAIIREVSNLITQRVKRSKDKSRNSGYCLRDIEAAFREDVNNDAVNDDQETPAQEVATPAHDDRCYDTPYQAQASNGASYGNVAFDTSNEEYRKFVEQQNNVTLTPYTPDMF